MTKPWTEKQTAALIERWGNESARLIAKVVGMSRNAVIGKAGRLGLSKPKPAPLVVVSRDGVSLRDADENACRYPVGDEGGSMIVCGQAVHETSDWRSPFCPEHHSRCYVQPYRRQSASDVVMS